MRLLMQVVLLVASLSASVNAGFEISLQQKHLQANSLDETVDIYLTASIDAEIRSFQIGAFVGSPDDVVDFGGVPPYQYQDDEGRFQLNSATATNGVQFRGEELGGTEYFWEQGRTTSTPIEYSTYWASNVAQARITFISRDESTPDHYPIAAGQTVKIGTFHIDTTGVTNDTLTLSLYGSNADLQYGNSPEFTVTTLATTVGDYAITDANALRVVGNTTFNIAATPEPSVIGFAGLGLTAGWSWLRARARRRSASRQDV